MENFKKTGNETFDVVKKAFEAAKTFMTLSNRELTASQKVRKAKNRALRKVQKAARRAHRV